MAASRPICEGASVKIAVLGGGGFRVPMVYGALLARGEQLGVDEVSLYDVDPERTARIRPVLAGLEHELRKRLPLRATDSLEDAV